jgi:hypothetical protein
MGTANALDRKDSGEPPPVLIDHRALVLCRQLAVVKGTQTELVLRPWELQVRQGPLDAFRDLEQW